MGALTYPYQVLGRYGASAEAEVSAVHVVHGKHGDTWTCDVRRLDGVPLAHRQMADDYACAGPSAVGQQLSILVDPYGWAASGEGDRSAYDGLGRQLVVRAPL
ncbi:hypothetical protein [Streptomyces sp. RPT161]|uniref:hypothetical protein n=1 Tax=Streptomyces sp. RPT161 TaxID=3015993 RepID=UPI0022B861F7|nr:hypothetical protein [Streptomyces sp. RPT161]